MNCRVNHLWFSSGLSWQHASQSVCIGTTSFRFSTGSWEGGWLGELGAAGLVGKGEIPSLLLIAGRPAKEGHVFWGRELHSLKKMRNEKKTLLGVKPVPSGLSTRPGVLWSFRNFPCVLAEMFAPCPPSPAFPLNCSVPAFLHFLRPLDRSPHLLPFPSADETLRPSARNGTGLISQLLHRCSAGHLFMCTGWPPCPCLLKGLA